ncbi:MAG: hydrogenase formation protein HypD [Proteobacteria bacterium]|nr:hydrogenase formation protein HypD [Pseudomonadota bacterium]MBU1456253.1 hydrogenase formation protein HypD [Pseudomonadota bacterium]
MDIAKVTTDNNRQKKLLKELHDIVDRPIRLMVACGTQHRTILQHGFLNQLPEEIDIVSGPGCSVCVMPAGHVDAFIKIAVQSDVITAACSDLIKVPGSNESLESVMKKGARVEIISSPMDALDIASREPDKIVVYPAVGFEATAPSVAETILVAAQRGLENFCVIPSIRLLPPTIDLLMRDPELNIQGLLSSDHFNTISDTEAYTVIAQKHHIPCCLAGFEVTEILEGIVSLVKQIKNGQSFFDNTSAFVYSSKETMQAREMVSEVFFAVDTLWRGLGSIKNSGFVIRDELSLYDATKRFSIRFSEGQEEGFCQCNAIISGRGLPPDCPAFGMACTTQNPIGPCMIADEGICSSYFKYNNNTMMSDKNKTDFPVNCDLNMKCVSHA